MFLQVSICPWGEGVSALLHAGIHTLQADTPPGRHFPGQTPPGRHLMGRPSPKMATEADGTHPIGMHSCLFFKLQPV